MESNRQGAPTASHFTIAIVEADENTGETLAAWVREMGHTAVRFASNAALLKDAATANYSLFLLDWGVADADANDLVRKLQSCGQIDAPVILCTVRGGEAGVVEALRFGADDFIVKPVRRHELFTRVGAALRRAYPWPADSATLTVPPFSIDRANRLFHVDGETIELQNREYALALMLFQNLNSVVPRARIIRGVWGSEPLETSRSLDTHISRVRRKLGLAGERGLILQSVYGLGYRLQVVALPPLDPD